jgi:adenylate cyclase
VRPETTNNNGLWGAGMKDPLVHEALRQIQEIVASDTGRALAPAARSRVEKVLVSAIGQLSGTSKRTDHTREVTIMLADLRGFTAIAAANPATVVVNLLNRCFVRMSEIIFRHHGVIDKFMGDSILVLFESSEAGDEGVRRALACAVDMQLAMEEMNRQNRQDGIPDMFFGIGINTGQVMSALLGSELYSEYTVIGDEVNLASRIESFSLRGQVLISESTWARCDGFVTTAEPMEVFVKGKSKVVVLREVLAIPSQGKTVPRQEVRRSPRVDVLLPIAYRMVENEVVVPQSHEGRILDIGYFGVLAEVERPIAQLSEVCLAFDLPLVGKRIVDLYARVVKVLPRGRGSHIGLEFTSVSAEHRAAIQLFVQLLIQGAEAKD